MGCLLSIISGIIKFVVFIGKMIIKFVMAVLLFLIRLGLLLPLIYLCVGLGLWISGNEMIAPGTSGFTWYIVGLCVLTAICLLHKIKKAMDKHNAKYDENGKRIKK